MSAAKRPAAKAAGSRKAAAKSTRGSARKSSKAKPKLLSGGNPQIAKGEGDAPVREYIAALPGWKRDTGRELDALIARTVPGVRKAVKWNSPFYGVEGKGWFLSFHAFTKYLKVVFFRGADLKPEPPVGSKDPNSRYYHVYEGEALDEKSLTSWIRQAAALPGWMMGSNASGRAAKSK